MEQNGVEWNSMEWNRAEWNGIASVEREISNSAARECGEVRKGEWSQLVAGGWKWLRTLRRSARLGTGGRCGREHVALELLRPHLHELYTRENKQESTRMRRGESGVKGKPSTQRARQSAEARERGA
ncbi:hypothetical protein EDB84DRAFT_1446568 [Lactarius hengduanensis]|nr:hypothetical protein EDB84DRAFT_1446568 [Lactarius hengduanensis]